MVLAPNSTEGLISRLAPSNSFPSRTVAAKILRTQLTAKVVHPAALVAAGVVTPLLLAAQAPHRTADFQPVPSTPQPSLHLADAALLLLGDLCSAATDFLSDEGWEVDDIPGRPGVPQYVNKSLQLNQRQPPELALEGGWEPWAVGLLLELPTLVSPFAAGEAEGDLVWPARVRYYEGPTLEDPDRREMCVVDVIEQAGGDEDEDVDAADEDDERVRQLVLGRWQGPGGFRESEVDLTHPPGSHLENWYTVTLAGMTLLSTQAATPAVPAPVLLLGLGGGALPNFFRRYAPRTLTLDAVEIDRSVATAAERWFGLVCTPSLITPEEFALADAEYGTEAGFPEKTLGPPCRVHVMDALDFVTAAPPASYAVILLDVYTEGTLPDSLLTPTFFSALRKLLVQSPSAALYINAGTAGDLDAVLELARGAFPEFIRVLVDPRTTAAAEAENAIVVAARRPIEISPKAWAALEVDAPFALKRVVRGGEECELRVEWGAPPTEEEMEEKAAPVVVNKAPDSIPEWGLFD
ncbi:hypothetical protein BDK51DRAFT_47574 [Blyttiomyces helicus]|uniref:S-adenosyl-L-methionine-dependent methyltransferase n=1 Tax=Blyttiomyces helicus TaxID=388810 RepID=A0A4V1IR95_9FUNG|nr:hypothetical protein BDK51DRAFT_47574 [Blyttiomyces helicus]|eukprot:RKO89277.1 hypothetical protein BDK51DRAFT_47574 [Blyttiomyces helicus]